MSEIKSYNQNLFEAIERITGHISLQSEMEEIIAAIEKDRVEDHLTQYDPNESDPEELDDHWGVPFVDGSYYP